MSEGWLWILGFYLVVAVAWYFSDPPFDASLCNDSTASRDPRCDREFYPFIF